MRARLIWLLIVWQTFFLNVLLPGHNRGALTLPGPVGPGTVRTPACCRCPLMGAVPKDKAPTQDQKCRCALCDMAMGQTLPPVFAFDLCISGRAIERLHATTPQRTPVAFAFPFYPSGPPALS